jgi:CSLREA domain-containing protein
LGQNNVKAPQVLFLTVLLTVLAAIDTYAAILTVTKTEDTNDGVCDADCSLREAVVAAMPSDIIVFSDLFQTPQTITLTGGVIMLNKNLTVTGTGSSLVNISGNNADRIFWISGGRTVTMSGLTIRDGHVGDQGAAFAFGGGIVINDGGNTLNLSGVEMTNNYAYNPESGVGRGAAIYAYGMGHISLDNVYLHNNRAGDGAVVSGVSDVDISNTTVADNMCAGLSGDTINMSNTTIERNTGIGVAVLHGSITDCTIRANGSRGISIGGGSSSTITINHSTITENMDGGLTNTGTSTVRDSIISNNLRSGPGAGIANSGTLYVSNSAIVGNVSGEDGGGIRTVTGQLFLTNSTVSGNIAGPVQVAVGGGIYSQVDVANPSGRITLTNSTIANNRSSGVGGGLRHDSTNAANIRNTVFAGNTSTGTSSEDVSGIFISEGINLVANSAGSSGWIPADLLNLDPLLGPLADNGGNTLTHALLICSPAINAGNNSLAIDPLTMMPLTGDQRGFARFVGGTVDIGAYEYDGATCVSPTPTFTPTDTPTNTPTATATATNTPSVTPSPFPEFDLTISQEDHPDPIGVGFDLVYILLVTNSPFATGGVACPNVRFDFPTGVPFSFRDADGDHGYDAVPDVNGVTFTGGCMNSFSGPDTAVLTVVIGPSGVGTLTSLGTNVVVDPENIVPEANESNNTAETIQTTVLSKVTATPTYTATPTGTSTSTNTPTNTPTFTPTATATFTPTATNTPPNTPTATPTATATPGRRTAFDYDADGRSDISVFRPAEGTWYLHRSTMGDYGLQFGLIVDRIAPADYDGDGETDIAVFRQSTGIWYVLESSTGTISYHWFGVQNDLPISDDYDGDGRADVAVFRNSDATWYIKYSHDGSIVGRQFGIPTFDKPTTGDFDGDGRTDLALFRTVDGSWYQIYSSDGSLHGAQFGDGGDDVVQADYDGDGITDMAVYRRSTRIWYVNASATATVQYIYFGLVNDVPVPADYDGDGRADICVFRQEDGNWYRINSSDGSFYAFHFGMWGDKPTQAAYSY